jgi:hypothetical protein
MPSNASKITGIHFQSFLFARYLRNLWKLSIFKFSNRISCSIFSLLTLKLINQVPDEDCLFIRKAKRNLVTRFFINWNIKYLVVGPRPVSLIVNSGLRCFWGALRTSVIAALKRSRNVTKFFFTSRQKTLRREETRVRSKKSLRSN